MENSCLCSSTDLSVLVVKKRGYMVPEGQVRNHVGADLDHHARHAFEMVSSILGCRKREVVECEKKPERCVCPCIHFP